VSTKTGNHLGVILDPNGKEYCRGEQDLTEDLAASSCSVVFLKARQKEQLAMHNSTLDGLGASGGMSASGLMSGRVARPEAPTEPAMPASSQFYSSESLGVWQRNKPNLKPAGLRTFKCEVEITAQFPPGATASSFCDDLSTALKAIMNGRSAQIVLGKIEEK